MRVMMGFVLSITALLPPTFAVPDPAQNPLSGSAQPATASAVAQPPAVTQAAAGTQTPSASQSATNGVPQTGPETVVVRGDKVDLNQIICKEEPAKTGSRLGGGRECHTQREWNQRMHDSQDITRRQQIVGFHQ